MQNTKTVGGFEFYVLSHVRFVARTVYKIIFYTVVMLYI